MPLGIANFDKRRYLGAWYEYSNVFEIFQIGGTCVRATYTDEGDKIGVLNEQVNTMYVENFTVTNYSVNQVLFSVLIQYRQLWKHQGISKASKPFQS